MNPSRRLSLARRKAATPGAPPELDDAGPDSATPALTPAGVALGPAGLNRNVPPGPPPADPVLAMIAQAARDPAVDVEKFERLMALRERADKAEAVRAFNAALALAKGELSPVVKTRLVDYAHKDERGRTSYRHEDFADIAQAVDPVLARHGLSYRHRTSQDGDKIRVTCILSHAAGHSEENAIEGFADKSGQKNNIQAIGSTITYLQRYSLKAALGLAAARDDDGRASEPEPPIDADDVAYVEQLLADTQSDRDKFLEAMGAPSVAELTPGQFKRAIGLLNEKKRRAANGPANA